MTVCNILCRVCKRCLSIQLLQKMQPIYTWRGFHHYVHYYLFCDIFLVWDMFPSAKIQGYLYRFLQISKWFRNFQTIAVAIRKQNSCAGGSQRLYRFSHGLKFWECSIHRPITQACLMSEHITCCLKRFSDISVTLFALNVQPDISEWIV